MNHIKQGKDKDMWTWWIWHQQTTNVQEAWQSTARFPAMQERHNQSLHFLLLQSMQGYMVFQIDLQSCRISKWQNVLNMYMSKNTILQCNYLYSIGMNYQNVKGLKGFNLYFPLIKLKDFLTIVIAFFVSM